MCLPSLLPFASQSKLPPTPSTILTSLPLPLPLLHDLTSQCTRDLRPLRLSPSVIGSTIRLWLLALRSGPRPSYPQVPDIDAEPLGVRVAFREYAALAPAVGEAYQLFKRAEGEGEEGWEMERVRLGVEWGRAAVRAAKARLSFLRAYHRAYRVSALDVHIRRAEYTLRLASKGVDDAVGRYEEMLKRQGHGRAEMRDGK